MSTLYEKVHARLKQVRPDLEDRSASLEATEGRSADLIRNLKRGRASFPRGSNIEGLARVLQVSVAWLIEAASEDTPDEPVRVPLGEEFSPDPDPDAGDRAGFAHEFYRPTVPGGRPELDVAAGAGDGRVGEERVVAISAAGTVTGHRVIDEWVIPPSVYRYEMRASPAAVVILPVVGDSMEPTLTPGDRIVVDTQQNTLNTDGVYVIDDGDGTPRVKRLTKVLFSTPPEVIVSSDNPMHGQQTVEVSRLRIIGRVCGRFSRM